MNVSRPELARILQEAGGDELLESVARQIAPYMGATRRFIDFMTTFLPDPPTHRTGREHELSWEETDLKAVFKKIYEYRSRALHSGIPFPAPMCQPPMVKLGDISYVAERPSGSATRMLSGTWLRKQTPILLNTFEYITRQALLKWWHHTSAQQSAS